MSEIGRISDRGQRLSEIKILAMDLPQRCWGRRDYVSLRILPKLISQEGFGHPRRCLETF